MNIPRLQAYILFLTKFHQKGGEEFVQLIDDLSHLITTRRTVLIKLIENTSVHKDKIYHSMLDLFAWYIKAELNSSVEKRVRIYVLHSSRVYFFTLLLMKHVISDLLKFPHV